MVARLIIQDGTPIWASRSIVPSRDRVVGTTTPPREAAINVNSTDVFVYVYVENPAIGSSDIGTCTCTRTGPWTATVPFTGFHAGHQPRPPVALGALTLTWSTGSVALGGSGINYQLGPVAQAQTGEVAGRMAWALSPDGRFFAYAISQPSLPGSMLWNASIIALQDIMRPNGSVIRRGNVAATGSGGFSATIGTSWNQSHFGWAGSSAVVAFGKTTSDQADSTYTAILMCPLSSSAQVTLNAQPVPGQIDLNFRISPCEGTFAIMPKRLNTSAPPRVFSFYATATGQPITLRQNNLMFANVDSTGPNPAITTDSQTANGVRIDTGNGTIERRDDPDCTFVGGGVMVRVDRVKASTLPSANLGVLAVGEAAAGSLSVGGRRWVQVPNGRGWANQSEQHWCLLAQAYTRDNTTIPLPWDGQAPMPPAFPVTRENCAQRNIKILP